MPCCKLRRCSHCGGGRSASGQTLHRAGRRSGKDLRVSRDHRGKHIFGSNLRCAGQDRPADGGPGRFRQGRHGDRAARPDHRAQPARPGTRTVRGGTGCIPPRRCADQRRRDSAGSACSARNAARHRASRTRQCARATGEDRLASALFGPRGQAADRAVRICLAAAAGRDLTDRRFRQGGGPGSLVHCCQCRAAGPDQRGDRSRQPA